MNGTRASSVAACAIKAKSITSCTAFEHSMAQPVWRGHHIGVIAEDRQALRGQRTGCDVKTAEVNSPAILYMLGIINSRPAMQ